MARFSQGLLQGLMQPAFGQNLYEVGRAAAAGPSMTRASQRMKEERERTQRGVTGGLFGLEQAVAEGRDYQDAIGSLVALGATPEQIAAAQERGRDAKKRTEEEARLGREQEAVKRLTSAAFMKAAKSKDPVSSEAFVRSLVDTQDLEGLRKFLGPKAEGTPAKPTIRSLYDPEKKMNIDYAISRDDKGNIVKTPIGPTKLDDEDGEADEADLGLDTKWGSALLGEARDKGRQATIDASTYDELADEAVRRSALERGAVGRTLSNIEETFGVAGQATIHRRRINEIRMSGALELLPAGPASDRDVQLALDASIDPNNLTNEAAESYLRGMAKIARAEAEYFNRKSDFIQETGDPNARGYDFWVKKEALTRDLKEMEATAPATMQNFNQKIAQANALQDPQQRQAALAALEQTFPEIVGIMNDLAIAENQWEDFSKGKNLKGFY